MKKRILSVIIATVTTCSVLTACSSKKTNLEISETNLISDAAITTNCNKNRIFKINDGKSSVWTADRQGSAIEIDFKEKRTFNTIVIKEPTDNIKKFSIFYWNGNNYTFLYRQDRIDEYRLCAVENTTSEKIKIVFDEFDDKISIEEIGVYLLDNYDNKNFKVTSYITSAFDEQSGLTEIQKRTAEPGYAERFKVLTDAIIIGVVNMKPDATLECVGGIENFKKDVELLRQFNPDMKIRCTIMTNLVPGNFKKSSKAMVKFSKDLSEYKANLSVFFEKTGIDGVDYDWEYPQLPHEWNAYSKILIASKEAIGDKDLSVALWPYGVMLSKEACSCIDNVNIMAYDQFDKRGDHSSIYEMGLETIGYFESLGFNKNQLCFGIPFYGRTADEYGIWPSYDEDYGKWDNYRENFTYTDNDGNEQTSTVYLNGYAMVRDKTALALQAELGGIMIFNSSCDISYESEYPLHKAVEEILDTRIKNN